MGLKEDIEKNRRELVREKKELERQKSEAWRNRTLLLHEKTLKLFQPYRSLIESSQCISILEELVRLEKLTFDRNGCYPEGAAHHEINIEVSCDRSGNHLTFHKLDLSDGFLALSKKEEEMIGTSGGRGEIWKMVDLDSLAIKSCCIYLEWDEHSWRYGGEGNYDQDGGVGSSCSKIEIIFTPSSIQVCGAKKEVLSGENINKSLLEKTISKAYVNPKYR